MNFEDYNDYELVYLVKENSDYANDIIFKKYEPIIKNMASIYKNKSTGKFEYEDLIQEGRIGLLKAIRAYDVNKGFLFYTFAITCIKGQILNYISVFNKKRNKTLNMALSIDEDIIETIPGNYMVPSNWIDEKELINKLVRFKNDLDYPESIIFELKYNDFSYKQISQLLEISIKSIDNKLSKIKRNLRKYLF